MALTVLRSIDEALGLTNGVHRSGARLALVPTMGYLHAGHLALVAQAKRLADRVAVSIFVNPTQFAPDEDFVRYPRDAKGDELKCEQAGVDALFAPEVGEMYPPGFQTFAEVGQLSRGLCGDKRPGHFRGVATVVTKLLCILRPDVALFGEKDYQQLQVIRRLNADLNLGPQIIAVPTVREPDGLAMSSRNAYLSAADRTRALAIFRGLCRSQQLVAQGVRQSRDLLAAIRSELAEAQLREDYVAIVDAETVAPLERLESRPAPPLVAAFAGSTRLIDNVGLDTRSPDGGPTGR